MVLARKAETLNDIIQAAQDAKCLKEQPSSDIVLMAVCDAMARLEAKTDVAQKCEHSPWIPLKSNLKWRS